MKIFRYIGITMLILTSTPSNACPMALSALNNAMALQGGRVSPMQYNAFQQSCMQENMQMNGGGYTNMAPATGAGGCSSGLYAGQNVHPDRCLGGMLATEIFKGIFSN